MAPKTAWPFHRLFIDDDGIHFLVKERTIKIQTIHPIHAPIPGTPTAQCVLAYIATMEPKTCGTKTKWRVSTVGYIHLLPSRDNKTNSTVHHLFI